MGNLPTRPHQTRCPNGVPWCINPRHTGPAPAHLADIQTINLRDASVGVILYRPVTETHPAASLVRVHYGPDFAIGLNEVNGTEPEAEGSLVGILSVRGPFGATPSAAVPPPATLRLSWHWSFADPASARCYIAGTVLTKGPS